MPWTRALVGLVALAIFAPAAKADTSLKFSGGIGRRALKPGATA